MHTLKRTRLAIFAGMLPAFIIYACIAILPIFISFYYSFFEWDGITDMFFVGLGNYAEIFSDDIFWLGVRNNVIIMLTGLLGQIPLGLLMALLLNRQLAGSAFFRTVGFLPVVISSVMVALIWNIIYKTENGMLNMLLGLIGLENLQQNWLGNPDLSIYSVSIAYIWQNFGLYMVIFLSALQGIPKEIHEAAEIDGASRWQKLFFVTIPMLKAAIMVSVIYSISNSFRVFDLVQILTGGGPARTSEVMTIYMYNSAFLEREYGYGSAASILIVLFSFVVVTIVNRLGRDKD